MANADATIKAFKGIIKRPPLTEKLLGKPPFHFLFDILEEVIKVTGVGEGLYEGAELDVTALKASKEGKIAFLQKFIDMTAYASKEDVAARPSKIVAGKNPEETNEWLQLVAKLCRDKVDTSRAVSKVLKKHGGGDDDAKDKKKDKEKERRDKSSSRDREKDDKDDRRSGRDRDREKDDKEERRSRRDKDKEGSDSRSK